MVGSQGLQSESRLSSTLEILKKRNLNSTLKQFDLTKQYSAWRRKVLDSSFYYSLISKLHCMPIYRNLIRTVVMSQIVLLEDVLPFQR